MFEFKDTVILKKPLSVVFDFFSQARNLEAITPDFLRFRVITPEPIVMRSGLRIQYNLRLHGIPLFWESEISEWNPPHHFTDEQIKGPYKYLIHRHSFAALDDNRTQMDDWVRYDCIGGRLINRFFVRPDVERIFAYRRKCMQERFGIDEGEGLTA